MNNLYNCSLEDHNLIFTIRCKKSSHHKSEHLGVAKFNFGVFNTSKNASCGKSLPIYLDENSSISVGNIKVTIQLGAGKLYFGQEFLGNSRNTSLYFFTAIFVGRCCFAQEGGFINQQLRRNFT